MINLSEVQRSANQVSTINTVSGYATDLASIFLSLFNLDFGGHLMKLSQMNKLLCRFRFLDVNYGVYLGGYFTWSSLKFDPPSKRP